MDVGADALQGCLARIHAADPLVVPVLADLVVGARGVVAYDGDEAVGVGFRRDVGGSTVVDIRVHPRSRRRGAGTALFGRLAEDRSRLLASCDAAHPRTGRFLEHRGFSLTGVVMLQRWDGEPDDVPRAFRNAEIVAELDPLEAIEVLDAAGADAWPPANVDPDGVTDEWSLRGAYADGRRVGVIAAVHGPDALDIRGCAVLPEYRGRGIGRALLTDAMLLAAEEDTGVTLRVNAEDEHIRAVTGALGFWTCRTWAFYERGAPDLS